MMVILQKSIMVSVGTVSGTSISFGTPVKFEDAGLLKLHQHMTPLMVK